MKPSEQSGESEQELGLSGKVAKFRTSKNTEFPVKFELQKNNAQYLGHIGRKVYCLSEIQN